MKQIFTWGLIALGCLLAGPAGAKDDELTEEIKLEQVPAAAQKTIRLKSEEGKGKIGDIEKVTEDGEVRYDATLVKGKVERNFSVSPDGKLLSWQVFMREIPEAARKKIREQSAKAKLGDIDRVTDEGKVAYEATMTKDEREISFSVNEEGRLLTLEVALAETPAKVRAAIQQQAAGAVLKRIERNTEDEDGEVDYDVEAVKDGRKISFSVDAGGNLEND
jgi:uncharacterized membrane protein YkoI